MSLMVCKFTNFIRYRQKFIVMQSQCVDENLEWRTRNWLSVSVPWDSISAVTTDMDFGTVRLSGRFEKNLSA